MRICCHSFLFANVILSQTHFSMGRVNSQFPAVMSATLINRHSFESPTPTIKCRHHKHGQWKTNTICTVSTIQPTPTSMANRSAPRQYTTLYCSTKVVCSHTTPKHKRPVHTSMHQNTTSRKHQHTSTTAITLKGTAATPTLELHPPTLLQSNINALLNGQLHIPTVAAFDDLPRTTNEYLSSITATTKTITSPSSSRPGPTVITASASHRLSTPPGPHSNDKNIATQSVRNNGSTLTSFVSGIGLGMGCMVTLGLIGLLIYYRRRRRRRRQQQVNVTNHGLSLLGSITYNDPSQQQHQQRLSRRPQSFMDIVASMVDKLPRSSSTLYQASSNSITGIAIGSGHGAVELASHFLDTESSIHSPSPQPT